MKLMADARPEKEANNRLKLLKNAEKSVSYKVSEQAVRKHTYTRLI